MKITSKQKGFRSYFDLSPQIPTRMKIAALCLTCFLVQQMQIVYIRNLHVFL